MSNDTGRNEERLQSLTCACAGLQCSNLQKKNSNINNSTAMGIVNPVVDRTQQQLRGVKQPDQGHTAVREPSGDLNLALLFLNAVFFTRLHSEPDLRRSQHVTH